MSPPEISHVVERAMVKVNGAPVKEAALQLLIDARVELLLGAPARATLRFFDEDFSLIDGTDFQIGAEVSVGFTSGTGTVPTEVFTGEIVAVAADQGPGDLHELVVTCFDKSHRLTRNTEPKTYLQMSYTSIISKIASSAGLRADVQMGSGGKITHPYLLQSVDDGAFINELTRRVGAFWRVDGNTLKVLQPPTSAPSPAVILTWGSNLVRFRARAAATEPTTDVTVAGWDPTSKAAIVANGTPPPSYETSTLAGTRKAPFGASKRRTTRSVVTSADEATALANGMRARTVDVQSMVRGEAFGDAAIKPGAAVQIAGVGTRNSGIYFLTSVEHVYTINGFRTRFTAGPNSPATVLDLVGAPAPSLALGGPVIGLVSNMKDPDGLGRIKVKFPTEGDNVESEWARVATLAAGNQRGVMFMPQLNDEVLVMFERGDARRPFIVGFLWNGKDKPPLATEKFMKPGTTHTWQIRTAKGHTLTFNEEAPTTEHVEIALADGVTKLYLGKDKVELWSNSKNLEVKSGQASVLLSQGKDVIIKGANVTIEAMQGMTVKGLTVDVTAKANAKIAASATASIEGTATTKVGGSGPTMVNGMPVKIN